MEGLHGRLASQECLETEIMHQEYLLFWVASELTSNTKCINHQLANVTLKWPLKREFILSLFVCFKPANHQTTRVYEDP